MLRKNLFILAVMFATGLSAQTGEESLARMYNAHKGKWYKTFTFVQQTETYRNDSLQRTATWYEASRFPHDLRIDIEDPKNGNAVIYRKDSTYRFQQGKLARVTAGTNPFTFILGGMYLMPFDSVKAWQMKVGGGWSETRVEFYFDGKLRQLEKYSDLKADMPLDERVFDPAWFGQVHWRQ
jgi:hypothetical protein